MIFLRVRLCSTAFRTVRKYNALSKALKFWMDQSFAHQNSEGLVETTIEAGQTVELEALRRFPHHTAVLHRVRAHCKQEDQSEAWK